MPNSLDLNSHAKQCVLLMHPMAVLANTLKHQSATEQSSPKKEL